MNTNNPWSNKPANSQKSGFGYQPNFGGQPSTPKPPTYGLPSGLPPAPFGAPRPIQPLNQPWNQTPPARPPRLWLWPTAGQTQRLG